MTPPPPEDQTLTPSDEESCEDSSRSFAPPGATVIVSETEIRAKVSAMGKEIQQAYDGEEITVVVVLHGAMVFVADLIRQLDMPLHLTAVVASSYRGATTSPTDLEMHLNGDLDIADRHVLLVDDILDTGRTLSLLRERCLEYGPRSVKVAALVDKPSRRIAEIEADFVGFQIPDVFVVGYGLDYNGRWRNLPDIVGFDVDQLSAEDPPMETPPSSNSTG